MIAKPCVVWIPLSLVGVLVGGCASSPAPPPALLEPRMPFPQYVTHRVPESRGGAAWRGGEREPALALDGQSCGLALDGRVRCWRLPPVPPTPLAAMLPPQSQVAATSPAPALAVNGPLVTH